MAAGELDAIETAARRELDGADTFATDSAEPGEAVGLAGLFSWRGPRSLAPLAVASLAVGGALLYGTARMDASSAAATAAHAAPDARVGIDHVVVAVPDLDAAVGAYRALGFTPKPGRAHANGLLNAHLKFADDTQLELMSLVGDASDEMARTQRTHSPRKYSTVACRGS